MWRNGRRRGFKIPRWQHRESSSLSIGTTTDNSCRGFVSKITAITTVYVPFFRGRHCLSATFGWQITIKTRRFHSCDVPKIGQWSLASAGSLRRCSQVEVVSQ